MIAYACPTVGSEGYDMDYYYQMPLYLSMTSSDE